MKYIVYLVALMAFLVTSCDGLKEQTKETINKGGETVGKSAAEFIEGVSEGVEKTLQRELTVSEKLVEKGLKTGKYEVKNDSVGENNLLTLYLIFESDFNSSIRLKALDKNGLEIGRSKLDVIANSGDAGYYDFKFDERTYIAVKSLLILE